MIGKNEYKRESSVQFVTDRVDIFLKKTTKQKTKRKRSAWVKP